MENRMSYDKSLVIYVNNMKVTIRRAKKDKIVGMSRENLKQIVSTRGIDIPVSAFHRLFDDAVKQVNIKGFNIYD